MAKNRFIDDNEFYCTQCGEKGIPVIRKRGSEREAGHLKKLYCLKCKKETNHVECRPWSGYTKEDFEIEFNYNNFTEDGLRKMPYGKLKGKIHNEKQKEDVCNVRDSRLRKINLGIRAYAKNERRCCLYF